MTTNTIVAFFSMTKLVHWLILGFFGASFVLSILTLTHTPKPSLDCSTNAVMHN